MKKDKYILEELMEVSPSLVQIEKTNVYSVSSIYFDNLLKEVMEKIHTGTEPSYYFSQTTPFTVPNGYFDRLPGQILQKALGEFETASNEVFEEMAEISPLLNTISKKTVFTVPDGYFESVQKPIANVDKPQSKVVSMKAGHSRFLKFLVAAAITALLAVGAFLFTGKDSTPTQALNSGPKVDVNHLSEQDIIEFLKTNSTPGEVTSASFNSINKELELKNSIKEMTDQEIQQFLQENEVPDEI